MNQVVIPNDSIPCPARALLKYPIYAIGGVPVERRRRGSDSPEVGRHGRGRPELGKAFVRTSDHSDRSRAPRLCPQPLDDVVQIGPIDGSTKSATVDLSE